MPEPLAPPIFGRPVNVIPTSAVGQILLTLKFVTFRHPCKSLLQVQIFSEHLKLMNEELNIQWDCNVSTSLFFRHVLEVHKKEKRHCCQICEKSFFKLSSKKRHELTHVTHDTWKCSSCMKIFKDSSSLKYHVRKKVCSKKTKLSQKSSIVLE